MKRIASILALTAILIAHGASAQTLKAVKDRGILNSAVDVDPEIKWDHPAGSR